MSNISYYMYKFKRMSKKKVLKLLLRKSNEFFKERLLYVHDHFFNTWKCYAESSEELTSLFEETYFDLNISQMQKEIALELWRMYKMHRFDLLGSGWIKVGFINNAPGIEGHRYDSIELKTDKDGEFLEAIMARPNVKIAKKIWRMITENDCDYEAIDWQKDFKSGYRWGTKIWYRPQRNAKRIGGDIKVPWELSRLQHLPRLAILVMILKEDRDTIVREYQNQLLDFIAQNPIRMGVNYMCTMDVAIRTANIALSYSLMKSIGISFTKEFDSLLCNFMFQQCDFIENNLEWSEALTSNHYFADIAGLLFGSAVLPECSAKKRWFIFAATEIQNEILKQFNEEGTNKEGSSAYHRLTAEMAIYSIALIESRTSKYNLDKIENEIYQRLYGASKFIHDLTRPDYSFSQLGDNDSGLFFKLSITGELLDVQSAVNKYSNLQNYKLEVEDKVYLDENLNDGRTFLSAAAGMFQEELEYVAYPLEQSIIRSLRNNKKTISVDYKVDDLSFKPDNRYKDFSYVNQYVIRGEDISGLDQLKLKAYPQFGVYIYQNESLYLCINLTENGQKGNGGHAHNDKLSFELFINGKCIFEDSGTFVYTALPEKRNQFRSVMNHNTICCGIEQNQFINLFSMKNDTECSVLQLGNNCFIGQVKYKGYIHVREIMIDYKDIKINDYSNKPFKTNFVQSPVTCGYGKLKN